MIPEHLKSLVANRILQQERGDTWLVKQTDWLIERAVQRWNTAQNDSLALRDVLGCFGDYRDPDARPEVLVAVSEHIESVGLDSHVGPQHGRQRTVEAA